ncbi:uncharacterized protein LOC142357945, partial [Convolutriloba macropyga]|uniref:uncharacterized protein LOC142357945 n=1 Tax=Convolutriloba macropyga TaxID=536237 RepID=UPI003F52766C
MASKYPAKSGGGKSRRSAKQDELENKDPEDMTTEELQSWNIQMAFDLGFIIKPGKKQPLKLPIEMIRDPEVKILTVNEFMRMSGLQRSGYIRLMSVKLDEYTKSDVTLPAEPEKPKFCPLRQRPLYDYPLRRDLGKLKQIAKKQPREDQTTAGIGDPSRAAGPSTSK